MKLIDEKGRLLGKINIIDLLVVIFILSMVPAFYFGVKTLNQRSKVEEVVVPPKQYRNIEISCRMVRLTPEQVKTMTVGDKEVDSTGQVIAEITKLGEVSDFHGYEYGFEMGQGQTVFKEAPLLKQRKVRLRLRAEVRQNVLYFKEKLVKLEVPLEFKTPAYSATAIPEGEEIVLRVRFQSVLPQVADLIDAGDLWTEYISDGSQKVLAKITKIISDTPTQIITKKDGMKGWTSVEPVQSRDLILEIKALCTRNRDFIYFENNRVRVGAKFDFVTNEYAMQEENSGVILEIIGD